MSPSASHSPSADPATGHQDYITIIAQADSLSVVTASSTLIQLADAVDEIVAVSQADSLDIITRPADAINVTQLSDDITATQTEDNIAIKE